MSSPFVVDARLARVIAQIESSNNPHAIRFEPTIYSAHSYTSLHALVQRYNDECSIATSQALLATSYGKYQIMGFNLYGLGFNQSVYEFLSDELEQEKYFDKYVIQKCPECSLDQILADEKMRDKFALAYNGSVQYGSRIAAAARELNL